MYFLLLVIATLNYSLCSGHSTNSSQCTDKPTGAGIEVPWASLIFPSDVFLRTPEPTGLEKGAKTYLCRAFNNNTIKPGALIVLDGALYCSINNFGAHKLSVFQMLDAPRGSTSWVPINVAVPSNAVIGGNHWNGRLAYLCRAWHENSLYIGNYADDGYCHTVKGSTPFHLTENLELLVLNHYGISFFIQ